MIVLGKMFILDEKKHNYGTKRKWYLTDAYGQNGKAPSTRVQSNINKCKKSKNKIL